MRMARLSFVEGWSGLGAVRTGVISYVLEEQ